MIDILFNREYLFVSKETGEAYIYKVVDEGTVKKSRYSHTRKVQAYYQREGKPWKKIQMEDFNKLGLDLIAEWNPESESKFDKAVAKLRKFAIEIECDLDEDEDVDYADLCEAIQFRLQEMESDEAQEEEDNYPPIEEPDLIPNSMKQMIGEDLKKPTPTLAEIEADEEDADFDEDEDEGEYGYGWGYEEGLDDSMDEEDDADMDGFASDDYPPGTDGSGLE